MTEETKQAVEQFLLESDYFEHLAHVHGVELLEEVTYALQQANFDSELLMSLFEDSQMWKHAMCLNDITAEANVSN